MDRDLVERARTLGRGPGTQVDPGSYRSFGRTSRRATAGWVEDDDLERVLPRYPGDPWTGPARELARDVGLSALHLVEYACQGVADPIAANRLLWDEWTTIHEASQFYDLDGFRQSGVRLPAEDVEAVGDVDGQTLLHLQCHFGIDTLSWARLGARATGVDFSARAIRLATSLADELRLPNA